MAYSNEQLLAMLGFGAKPPEDEDPLLEYTRRAKEAAAPTYQPQATGKGRTFQARGGKYEEVYQPDPGVRQGTTFTRSNRGWDGVSNDGREVRREDPGPKTYQPQATGKGRTFQARGGKYEEVYQPDASGKGPTPPRVFPQLDPYGAQRNVYRPDFRGPYPGDDKRKPRGDLSFLDALLGSTG